jgi:hypothetical protein
MHWLPRLWHLRPFGHRLCAGTTLVVYAAVALGFPVPVHPVKDHSQPFPCQDHPCGCHTAEECWSHCCCFTPEERWAWAREHGVEPPAYAERPHKPEATTTPANGWHTPRVRALTSDGCTHCTEPAAASRCCENQSCCQAEQHASRSAQKDPPRAPRWTSGLSAFACHGQGTMWVSTGAVTPPPTCTTWHAELACTGRLGCVDIVSSRLSSPPAEPPPRPGFIL